MLSCCTKRVPQCSCKDTRYNGDDAEEIGGSLSPMPMSPVTLSGHTCYEVWKSLRSRTNLRFLIRLHGTTVFLRPHSGCWFHRPPLCMAPAPRARPRHTPRVQRRIRGTHAGCRRRQAGTGVRRPARRRLRLPAHVAAARGAATNRLQPSGLRRVCATLILCGHRLLPPPRRLAWHR